MNAAVASPPLKAPFPYFGGKRDICPELWRRFGRVKHYIEPFCGSAAALLANPFPANLEVINDLNGFVANFWRATKYQAAGVALAADYPVSHIDLGARHKWLVKQSARIGEALQDAHWPGDAQVAGWWLWGQCCWIGSGWCEFRSAIGQVPHAGNAGRGVQAIGKVPHAGNAGRGVQAIGQVPHASDAGRGWLLQLSARLQRVRIVHGAWFRCLNHHYGGEQTAVFLDPPYKAFEGVYDCEPAAELCEEWARIHPELKIALCGHAGDYELPGWTQYRWKRKRLTYSSAKTTNNECIWFSPACGR